MCIVKFRPTDLLLIRKFARRIKGNIRWIVHIHIFEIAENVGLCQISKLKIKFLSKYIRPNLKKTFIYIEGHTFLPDI